MTCAIIATSVSCGLGHGVTECVESLRHEKVRVEEIELDQLEDTVRAPYFRVANATNRPAHECMYDVIREVLHALIKSSGLGAQDLAKTGLFFGSSSFTVSDSEYQYFSALEQVDSELGALAMPIVGYNKLPELLAQEFGLSSCVHSYATACTSSANALIYADLFIERGDIDHAIVIGSEFYNATTLLGFYGLELLSPQGKMMPFDSRRDGLILGEGCGAIMVSKEVSAADTRFLGGACNTDTFSLTAANVDGSTIAVVMRQALAKANTAADKVRAVKVHGTASLMNDEAEAAGLVALFGDSPPPLFALKPYIGHTLGACGVVELALLHSSLSAGFVPSNPGIAVERSDTMKVSLSQQNSEDVAGVYVLNYFAFGGNNVSLILEHRI